MQLTETLNDGLKRAFRVEITAETLQERLSAKIKEMQPRMQLKGFRPGKVPLEHIRKLYGPSILEEIVQGEVQSATKEVVEGRNLRIAVGPNLSLASDMKKVAAGAEGLVFDLALEVLPDIELADFSTIAIERPLAEVSEEDVDQELQSLAEGSRTFETKSGAAEDGDAVVIDYLGKIDGEPFEGGAGEEQTIVIGSGQFIPGFEDGVKGLSSGDEKTIEVTFPEAYGVERLAGKAATFDVKVHEVRAPKTPELNDEFAQTLGLDSIGELRQRLKDRLGLQFAAQSRLHAKRALFDRLDELHQMSLPATMVDQEFQVIWRDVEAQRARGNLDPDDAGKSEDELRADYRKIAERRVKLGLVLAEVGGRAKLTITDDELRDAIIKQARRFPGQEEAVIRAYQRSPELIGELRAPIYEEKAVDYILELAKVTDKPVDRETLFSDPA